MDARPGEAVIPDERFRDLEARPEGETAGSSGGTVAGRVSSDNFPREDAPGK